jgi:hypothetical protein
MRIRYGLYIRFIRDWKFFTLVTVVDLSLKPTFAVSATSMMQNVLQYIRNIMASRRLLALEIGFGPLQVLLV